MRKCEKGKERKQRDERKLDVLKEAKAQLKNALGVTPATDTSPLQSKPPVPLLGVWAAGPSSTGAAAEPPKKNTFTVTSVRTKGVRTSAGPLVPDEAMPLRGTFGSKTAVGAPKSIGVLRRPDDEDRNAS